jgi:SAM-dependent methyltransferase
VSRRPRSAANSAPVIAYRADSSSDCAADLEPRRDDVASGSAASERGAGLNANGRGQDYYWDRHAERYEKIFLDPYDPGVINPLWKALDAIEDPASKTVVDLGCGTGPLLTRLIDRFARVVAIDFAPAMIEIAKRRLGDRSDRVVFRNINMSAIDEHESGVDVAIAVNSLVAPEVGEIAAALRSIRACLKPGGVFLGVVPSIDAIHYHTMLLYDEAIERGLSPREADRHAAIHAEHRRYDFAFGRFRYQGIRQKFWQPFEIIHRLRKAGFEDIRLDQVLYPWGDEDSAANGDDRRPPGWDWSFVASTSELGR